jgi:hypothetical protein
VNRVGVVSWAIISEWNWDLSGDEEIKSESVRSELNLGLAVVRLLE